MKTCAVIPARGGSEGIPRKNLAELGGEPLLWWTVKAALASRIDDVYVSTEDAEIAEAAEGMGAKVIDRPYELAEADVASILVVKHALEVLEGEGHQGVVLLHPTSPLRTHEDIDHCLDLLDGGFHAVVSVTEPDRHPWLLVRPKPDGRIVPVRSEPLPARQHFPPYYAINGAIYAARIPWLMSEGWFGAETYGYVMPPERSIDIDDPEDLERAEEAIQKVLAA